MDKRAIKSIEKLDNPFRDSLRSCQRCYPTFLPRTNPFPFAPQLLTLDCGEGDIQAVSEASFKALQDGTMATHDPSLPQFEFAYKVRMGNSENEPHPSIY